jgi:hypothetical protein
MTNTLNPTHLVHTGLDLLAAYFTRMSHVLQEENRNEKKYEKRGQEEESELRILILLKASPLFRCLGKRHRLKVTDE